jgi:hypothetical protein
MKDADISGLIKKAKESLGAAEQLLKSGYSDFSAKFFICYPEMRLCVPAQKLCLP